MAENDDAEERTESPTPKRLEEARKRGQIPRSRDFTSAAVMLAGGAGLNFFGGTIASQMHAIMRSGLTLNRDEALDATFIVAALSKAGFKTLLVCGPLFALLLLAALLAPMMLGGWNFSSESLMPKFERINPLAGLKRMFALHNVVELIKAMGKFGIVAAIAVVLLRHQTNELLNLGREPLGYAIVHATTLCGDALIALSCGLLVIAGIDVPYQLWQHSKQLKMTREEVRQEMKESEGSPEVKGRVRQLQQEMARRRMMQEVPKADVIITNPTHFAVALRYDEKRNRAPVVVAKGADLVAARIREIATEHSVPLFEAPPLARTLFRHVDLGREIPATLYVAVAQVLSYVFQLQAAKSTNGPLPPKPTVDVKEE
jgi:flagellar biosynthetic protein FlhB